MSLFKLRFVQLQEIEINVSLSLLNFFFISQGMTLRDFKHFNLRILFYVLISNQENKLYVFSRI